ncbi:hypothetical protein V1288_005051 [Bradyrhizobium sp. AZCC 2176]
MYLKRQYSALTIWEPWSGCHDLARAGLRTPCSIDVPAPDAGFSVTFASPKFQPVTVPVQVIRNPGDFASPATTTIIEPSPVFAELKPAAPPPRVRKPMRPKQPKPPKAAAAPDHAPAQPAAR